MLNFCCQIPNEAKMRKKHKSYLIHFPGVISAPSLETYLEGRRQLLENEMQLRNFFLPFFFIHIKGTLHFNINLGSKVSLDPP